MNDSDFVVAFNILDSGYRQWWLPAFGLLGMTLIFVILTIIEKQMHESAALLKVRLIAFCFLCMMATLIGTFWDYWKCSHDLASGKASYVEGIVDNFVPESKYKYTESFSVRGVPFYYSDDSAPAGFNTTIWHGGPIHQGLPVRIWYVGDEIVKLEIKK